ncbi:hypothetical protein [Mycobacterium sp.]|uniref:hypothetical protein n=1 Tax=Mycobacterium sp. TaxID=1785 RepID=UPI003BAB4140
MTQHGTSSASPGSSAPDKPAAGTVSGGPPVPGVPDYGWQYAAPPRSGNGLVIAGIVIGVAALAVGIIALATRPAPAPTAVSVPSTSTGAIAGDDARAADRALCMAIVPLMAESDRISTAWTDAGKPGTPARDAATPKFISETVNWIGRAQPVLDQYPDVDPFFRRSLQRFIDDRHLLVDLTPGPLRSYAKSLYEDSMGAYSGPLHICYVLGVKW